MDCSILPYQLQQGNFLVRSYKETCYTLPSDLKVALLHAWNYDSLFYWRPALTQLFVKGRILAPFAIKISSPCSIFLTKERSQVLFRRKHQQLAFFPLNILALKVSQYRWDCIDIQRILVSTSIDGNEIMGCL